MSKISKTVGIDLGTTNSCIALQDKDGGIICLTDNGQKTYPSVVYYDKKKGVFKSGRSAFNRRGSNDEPIVSIKSHMGDSEYHVTTGGQVLSPIEVSAKILKAMKEAFQAQLSNTPGYENYLVDRAVITIPAYFPANAREATTAAGELAGLTVEMTLPEPTAAAMFYCRKNDIEDGNFMVFDLGGGTFDVSIVNFNGGAPEVVGLAGDNYLGGDNIDEKLAWLILDKMKEDENCDYCLDLDPHFNEEDKHRFTKLKLAAENVKKRLSSEETVFYQYPGCFVDAEGNSVNIDVEITRDEFDAAIMPVLEPTIDKCREALNMAQEKANVTLDRIDAVLLVGGSTHIPLVSKIVEKHFCDPSLPVHAIQPHPIKHEPDMAVGYGASLVGASFGENVVADEDDNEKWSLKFDPAKGAMGLSTVNGVLSKADGTLPLNILAEVKREADGQSFEFPVAPDGTFAFIDLTYEYGMPTSARENYLCSFKSGNNLLIESSFDANPKDEIPPVTLARTYSIKTLDEMTGDTKLRVLMERGTNLPITKEYSFHTNAATAYGAKLEFYEEARSLKTITFNFKSEMAPGVEIKLYLSCNQKSQFSGKAVIPSTGESIELEFAASPLPPPLTAEEVENAYKTVLKNIEDSSHSAKDKLLFKSQAKRLFEECYDAIYDGDNVKAQDRYEQLLHLPPKGRKNEEEKKDLMPPKPDFDYLVDQKRKECEEKNKDDLPKVDEYADAGHQAYEDNDQQMLTWAVNGLNSLPEDGGRPPKWVICASMSQQTLEFISKCVENRKEAHPNLREKIDAESGFDSNTARTTLQKLCAAQPDDSMCPNCGCADCNLTRELYFKWQDYYNKTESGHVS